jgi:DNA-binding LytR/AlgR family response regulator
MNAGLVLVVEDEAPQREALVGMLAELQPDIGRIIACEDGLAALELLQQEMPRIAFLDIRLPGVNGLEVARALAPGVQVVFTTAYDEYAVRAFDAGAVDYLLKPIRRERLEQAWARLQARQAATSPDLLAVIADLQRHLAEKQKAGALRWITATVGTDVKMFPIDDVLFFQAQDKYTRVVTASDEAVIRMSLKELLAGLDPVQFWQVHRSVIVRANAIARVRRDELGKLDLSLRGLEETLPVSQAFQYRFKGM